MEMRAVCLNDADNGEECEKRQGGMCIFSSGVTGPYIPRQAGVHRAGRGPVPSGPFAVIGSFVLRSRERSAHAEAAREINAVLKPPRSARGGREKESLVASPLRRLPPPPRHFTPDRCDLRRGYGNERLI